MGINFDKDPLVVEQNNYATKIVNSYIVCELDARLKVSLDNFKLKNCLFGPTDIVKNNDKESWCIVAMEQHLVEQVHEILVITLLRML